MKADTPRRRAANLTLDTSLLAEAKSLSVNVSRAAEAGIAEAIARERESRWKAENRQALESSNEYVRRHGLPLAKYRLF